MRLFEGLFRWWQGKPVILSQPAAPHEPGLQRRSFDHVIILDGTLSTLLSGQESNAGLVYRLLTKNGPVLRRRVYYEPGLQWQGVRHIAAFLEGRGINIQIRRAYGWLATHYREGDRIFLFGYSRGAFAVRSLAGMIDRVGLVRREEATERTIRQVWRHYRRGPDTSVAQDFAAIYCHRHPQIEMIGVWDTVMALGVRLPLIWKLTNRRYTFHNYQLGQSIRHGFHALALHETREAFTPVMWECPPDRVCNIKQVWFRGAHGDVGGQIGEFAAARPLANIPLVWMLEQAESCGLTLPTDWHVRFPCDAHAPMVGTMQGWGKLFLLRRARVVGHDRSESIHPSAGNDSRFPIAHQVSNLATIRQGSGHSTRSGRAAPAGEADK